VDGAGRDRREGRKSGRKLQWREGVEERRYSLSRESYEVEQVMMRHWIMLGRVVYVRL